MRVIVPSSAAYRRWTLAKCKAAVEVCEDLHPLAHWHVHIILEEVTLAAAIVSLMSCPETTLVVFGCQPPTFNMEKVIVEIRIGWPEANIFPDPAAADAFLQERATAAPVEA